MVVTADAHTTMQTAHERWFVETFGRRIGAALPRLEMPATDEYAPEDAWEPFKAIYEEMKAHSGTRAAHQLQLQDISPRLAEVTSSAIFMPGLSLHELGGSPVFVQAFRSAVTILPTKTKPKKMTLLGSDGRQYT